MSKYTDFFDELEKNDEYWSHITAVEFLEELAQAMETKGINRAELARSIGSKPAYITKVFQGNANFTLETMTKLSRAFGLIVKIHLAPPETTVVWRELNSGDAEVNFDLTQPKGGKVSPLSLVYNNPSVG